jgi:predicted transcriptional regulator
MAGWVIDKMAKKKSRQEKKSSELSPSGNDFTPPGNNFFRGEEKIRQCDLELLQKITPECCRNKSLMEELGIAASTVSNRVSSLVRAGLVVRDGHLYYVTSLGKQIVSSMSRESVSPGKQNIDLHSHAYQLKMAIRFAPPSLEKRLTHANWVAFYPEGYVAYKRRLFGAMVIFYPKSVVIHLSSIWASSPRQADALALEQAEKIRRHLENKYSSNYQGLRLGTPTKVFEFCNRHHAIKNHRHAQRLLANGKSYRSDRIAVDASGGIPEEETIHPVHATEDGEILIHNDEVMIRNNLKLNELIENVHGDLNKVGETLKELSHKQVDLVNSHGDIVTGTISLTHVLANMAGAIQETSVKLAELIEKLQPKQRSRWHFWRRE